MLAESEMLPFRTVVAPLPMAGEARAYAVISIREEVPTLEIRQEEVKDVAEADQEQIKIEPYEIETKEPELPAIPVKAENEGIKEKETIPVEVKAEEMAQEIPPVQQRKPPPELIKPELPSAQRIGNLTIGFGYGPSYGGMGASLQLNTKSGLSLHAGAGYYPSTYYYSDFDWLKNRILFSAGIKYYLPFKSEKIHPYLDLQYGGLTVEAVQIPSAIYEGEVLYENLQKNLYGVSFLGGLELKFGRAGARGALGISYNTTEWEYWDRNIFLNGEFALVVYF